MTDFLFGESTNSLLAAEESEKLEATQLLAAFDRAVIGIRKTLALGVLRFLRRHNQEQDKAIAEVHRFVDKLISRAIERNAGAKHDNQRRTILVDELLKDSDDHQYLRSQLLNIFGGGRDTAAVAASQVFFQLARQPEVWSKLRAEVLAIQEPLSFELFKSMKYLQNVLRECMFQYASFAEVFC
jgi:cytochrome P450